MWLTVSRQMIFKPVLFRVFYLHVKVVCATFRGNFWVAYHTEGTLMSVSSPAYRLDSFPGRGEVKGMRKVRIIVSYQTDNPLELNRIKSGKQPDNFEKSKNLVTLRPNGVKPLVMGNVPLHLLPFQKQYLHSMLVRKETGKELADGNQTNQGNVPTHPFTIFYSPCAQRGYGMPPSVTAQLFRVVSHSSHAQ